MSMNSVYQILKAIDVAFENQDFKLERDLNLEKLNLSKHRRTLILETLSDNEYIEGISVAYNHSYITNQKISSPRLTLLGRDYLENNSSMKKAYAALKELKEWIPGY